MANNYWTKAYIEMLDDPKVGRLSDRQFRVMMYCFLLAGEQDNDGYLIPFEDMVWRFRMEEEELQEDLEALDHVKVLEEKDGLWFVTNHKTRQARISNAERQADYRKRQRGSFFGEVTEGNEEQDELVTNRNGEKREATTKGNEEYNERVTTCNKDSDASVTNRNADKEEDKEEDEDRDEDKDEDRDEEEQGIGGFKFVQKDVDNFILSLEKLRKEKTPEAAIPICNFFFIRLLKQGVVVEDFEKAWGWYMGEHGAPPGELIVLKKPILREMAIRTNKPTEIEVNNEFAEFVQH
ncbi:MAG: hypothetical protein K8R40_02405 [Anaerolineaceae bacterium]|nr:hypothetical protein [Anaerolineaceae bacterium]